MQPTATQRVRSFLDAHGMALAPWSALDETYGRLYELLDARRADPRFWETLERLLGQLAEDALFAGAPRPLAELLDETEIERLVADLRRALPTAEAGRGPFADFIASLAAPALCGFLLIGAAASSGCASRDEGTSSEKADPVPLPPTKVEPAPRPPAAAKPETADAGAPAPAAQAREPGPWFDGCVLDRRGVLWRHLARSALPEADKEALCDCFAALDRRWANRLDYLFREGRPAEIAKALEEMVACCEAEDKAADAACRDVTRSAAAVQRREILAETGAVLYKGVCFP